MSETPVMLDFNADFCSDHLEPFREHWPRGAGMAMLLLFDAFMQDPRVIEMAPKDEQGLADSSRESIEKLLTQCRPLCCFLPETETLGIIAEALEGYGPRHDAFKARNRAPRESA